jgi:light-regulated signal transduction histidine kinase (bacteriophytochrome)
MTLQSLQREYAATLGNHLATADEASLHRAYELGRNALGEGLGVLDLVLLHHAALGTFAENGSLHLERARLDRAAEFLAESLSPFEMSLRGYRDANVRLAALNETLERAKSATELANRELEAFSYSVAHDLRAPLRSIDGFSQALLEDFSDRLDEAGKQHLRYVRESAQEMAELIDGLLSLSRVTRRELQREPVDLSGIARAIFFQLRRIAPERSVETIVADDLIVEGDHRLLRVALENLIGNAWKFTSKRAAATIEIGVVAGSEPRTYFVRDDGAGFDMAYQAKLFGVFQRLHAAREFEGTGIGLATVQRVVSRHGGRVWAEGEVDRGATFYFTLWATA